MAQTGCFGSLIRVILGIVNTLFLFIGIIIFTVAAVLRWSPNSILNKITENDAIHSILDVSAINGVTLVLLIIGSFISILSLIGLAGVCCTNRFFLFIYEIVIVLLFLSHAIVLIIAAFKSTTIETEFRKALNSTIEDLNTGDIPSIEIDAKCKSLKFISELFECCGSNGPQDFLNQTLVKECCIDNHNKVGCADKTVSVIKSNGINYIVIPNSTILGFEFLIILLVPFLIGRITRSRRMYEEEEAIINVKPTSFNTYYRNN